MPKKKETCPTCDGSGKVEVPGTNGTEIECGTCDGSGKIEIQVP